MTTHQSKQARRKQILTAAEAMFVAHGYERASLAAIATLAGLSKGAVNHHYSSKHALFLDSVRFHFEKIYQALQMRNNMRTGPEELVAIARRYAEYLHANTLQARFSIVMTEVAMRDEACLELLNTHYHYPALIAIDKVLRGESIDAQIIPWEESTKLPENSLVYALKAVVDGLSGAAALGQPVNIGETVQAVADLLVNVR